MAGIALLGLQSAEAREIGVPPPPIYNFYGQVGLLDMPTAEFAPDGELAISVSTTKTLDRYNLAFQALPWLETAFRYSRVDKRDNGRDLYDRSLSFKIRLVQESATWPSVAVGVQDVLGTGVFGAEYLVASKHIGDFSLTGGLGWRRFGGIAQIDNPLGMIFPSFKQSDNNFGEGGVPSLNSFFHGPKVGFFGGATWQTPIDGLALIAEASGDQFTTEQKDGAIKVRTPFNFGFAYSPLRDLQIGGGYFYGSELGIRITLSLNAFDEQPGPRLGTQPTPWHIRDPEERTNATLAYVQHKTKLYDNDPWGKIAEQKNANGTDSRVDRNPDINSITSFADAVYSPENRATFNIKSIESFGDELIVATSSRKRISCAEVSDMTQEAATLGFKNVIITHTSDPSILICGGSAYVQKIDSPILIAASGENDAPGQELNTVPLPDATDPDSVKDKIIAAIKDQKIGVAAIHITEYEAEIAYVNAAYRTDTEAVGRILRVLMKVAPVSVEKFRLIEMTQNLPTSGMTFIRSDLERTLQLNGSAGEILASTALVPAPANDPLLVSDNIRKFPDFGFSLSPGYRQSLFDPNAPYMYQIYATASAGVTLNKNLSIAGSFEAEVLGNLRDSRKSNSVLPHVRSDFLDYYTKGKTGISSLQASYFDKLSPDVYFFARAGILEDMFAGVGGEIYWQPAHMRWALGGALYAVQQRSPERLFSFRDYRVITGHASIYYNSPYYGMDFALHVGRYLAGDYGATLQITRRFENGIEIGAFATLTNVPFKQYGEGSFDKGFIVRIPIDNLLPVNTQDVANLDFSPLTRDGGQRLYGEQMIHDLLLRSSEGEFMATWDKVLNP